LQNYQKQIKRVNTHHHGGEYMGRDHTIRRYRKNDLELFKIVARYGHASTDDFSTLKISNRRAKDFTRKNCGLLETFTTRHHGQAATGYRLTRKGKKFVQDRLDIQYPQKSGPRTYSHNEALKHQVQSLEKDGARIKRFFTENELKHIYHDDIKAAKSYQEIGITDCLLEYENGDRICVEVTTSNYSQITVNGKCNFADLISAEIILHKAF